MTSLWPHYAGSPGDNLRVEVFEIWLERLGTSAAPSAIARATAARSPST